MEGGGLLDADCLAPGHDSCDSLYDSLVTPYLQVIVGGDKLHREGVARRRGHVAPSQLWLLAISSVIHQVGPQRAQFLSFTLKKNGNNF